ncbi:Protein kinase [uncultured virus]|nr:Protein kinase [uncultured virus]
MKITTADIERYNDRMLRIFEQRTEQTQSQVAKWRLEARRRLEEEMSFIETRASACPVGDLDKITGNTSFKTVKTILDQEFYNPEVMEAVSCSIYSVFFGLPSNRGNASHMNLAKKFVSNLHQIGSESTSGYALTGDIKDVKDLFVIKVPKRSSGSADLYHELFVGLFGTNYLRKYVPNFAFVYGGFRCGSPLINPKTREVIDWCSFSEKQVPYLLMEAITPSIDFGSYLERAKPEQFLSGYLQTLFAIKTASERIGFTHYDLHTGNCLMRDISSMDIGSQFSIPYRNDDDSITYVTADRVLTIIDYGQSYTEYNGSGYGSDQISLYEIGVINGPWPLFDAYKLLMFAGDDAIRAGNEGVLIEARRIFKFFNDSERFDQCVKTQRKFYYGLPKLPGRDQTIDDLIAHVIKSCDAISRGIISDQPLHNVLECTQCYTFAATMKETGAYMKVPEPSSFVELLDVSHDLKDSSRNDYEAIVKSFPYDNAKDQFKSDVQERTQKLSSLLDRPHDDVGELELDDPETLSKAIRSHYNLVDAVNVYESLLSDYKTGKSLSLLYQDQQLEDFIEDLRVKMITQYPLLKSLATQVHGNYRVVSQELEEPGFINFLKSNRKFAWYANSASDVVGVLERLERDILRLFEIVQLPAVIVAPRMMKGDSLYPKTRRVVPSYDKHNNITGIRVIN